MSDPTTTTAVTPTVKPGWKTSEFWLASAAFVVGTLMASGAISDAGALGKALAFVGAALASAGYSYSRGQVKSA